MPLRGEKHSDLVKDEAPYFVTLSELDTWFSRPHDKLSGVIPYQPRPHPDGQSDNRPKLLVCHDYKGGYKEFPSGLNYTFNFWQFCDTFVYFSHHRVTVPPSGWINSAHKQGSRMLGTLIVESSINPDTVQLIVGRTGYEIKDNKIPISKRYAVYLAELAHQRGFDGYLLNFESSLQSGANHARALASWILLLRAELRARVGSYAQVVWYDSVIYDGWVLYQNRLDGYNLPFFLASDALFTDYGWVPDTQRAMLQYFKNLQPVPTFPPTKTLQDIYTGIDVWGRKQYGGGGFCTYRGLTYTTSLGFSTALFGPGWTWEKGTVDPEHNWDVWWGNERKLWLGLLKDDPPISCPGSQEGAFKPVADFFRALFPPNPSSFVFYTSFSPGVGYSWFVEGKSVLDTKRVGWMDIDKQGSVGNLVWPLPTPSWQDTKQLEPLPTGSSTLDMTDGYNGGNTLKLSLNYTGHKPDNADRSIWLPVQSIAVTSGVPFEARVAVKFTPGVGTVRLGVRSQETGATVAVGQPIVSGLQHGWTLQRIDFKPTSTAETTSVAIGLVVSSTPADPQVPTTFSFSLGELAVYPSPPPSSISVGTLSISEAKFALTSSGAVEGALTWDTNSTFTPASIHVDSAESTTPAWLLSDTPAYRFPTCVYFNIYAEQRSDHLDPANAVFIGTTGLDGRGDRFYVERTLFPTDWPVTAKVRFYIQGVTDRGEVLPWDRCGSVDA